MAGAPAVGLAILAALAYGVASALEAEGARRVGGARALVSAWTAGGLALDALAWAASLAALRSLPVVVVQALLAGSVVVTAVLVRWTTGARMRRVDAVAIGAAVVALTALAASGVERPGPEATHAVVGGALAAAALLTAVAAGWYRTAPAGALAVVGGLGFSLTAFAARAAHGAPASGAGTGATSLLATVRAVVLQPLTIPLVVGGAVGLVCFLAALERGPVGPLTAVLWTVEVVVPGAAGLLVLGDRLRPGWDAPALVAAVVAVAACATLACSPVAGEQARAGA